MSRPGFARRVALMLALYLAANAALLFVDRIAVGIAQCVAAEACPW